MTTALQQQVFALDARYNAHRAPNHPNFRTLYIRRRSQLLRETERDAEKWKQYFRLRSTLLQQRYGSPGIESTPSNLSRSISRASVITENPEPVVSPGGRVVPTRQAEASRAMAGGTSLAENYAFVGVHHIFDQHTQAVTMVKFAHNDRSKLCCSSLDGTLSICDVTSEPPKVEAILKGHQKGVTAFDWSADNDLIVSTSLDGTSRVWKVSDFSCLRIVKDPQNAKIFCCLFQPTNNNLFFIGNSKGEIINANISTGRYMDVCKIGGNILSLAFDSSNSILWAGNDKGEIISVFCELGGGISKRKKLIISPPCTVTNLSYRVWISREARDPLLLVNTTNNMLYLFGVTDGDGTLQVKRRFDNKHEKHMVRSTFCPIMSFRQGACVVTGSEDGTVYFINVEKMGGRSVFNTLQGHSSVVIGISFNYNESLLATSDYQGLVIIWKKGNST